MCTDDADSCMAIIPASVSLIAVLFGLTGTLWCTTFKIEPLLDNLRTFELGLFTVQDWDVTAVGVSDGVPTIYYSSSCVDYGSTDPDQKWRSAAILQPVSWGIGIVLSCILFAASCGNWMTPTGYKIIGFLMIFVVMLFQALIWIAMDSNLCTANPALVALEVDQFYENSCSISGGSGFSICAVICYFVAGALCCCLGKPQEATTIAAPVYESKTPDEEEAAAAEPAAEEEPAAENEAAEEGGAAAEATNEGVEVDADNKKDES